MINTRSLGLVSLLFFFSGLAALVYEVVWTRLLALIMGSTVLSVTTVLAAFMGGLALGSAIGGRMADRLRRPLVAYAILEVGVGILGLFVPLLVAVLKPLYSAAYASVGDSALAFGGVQFLISGCVILVPSALMGATLPILSRQVVRSLDEAGGAIGRLYAVNTFGAVAGSLLTGFVLLPSFGLTTTTVTAAVLNGFVALGALVLGRGGFRATETPASVPSAPVAPSARIAPSPADRSSVLGPVLAALTLAGATSMIDQVAWTRVLTLILGSSTYAFSLMVSAFILGLALGSAAAAPFVDRMRNPVTTLASVEALVAASTAVLIPVFSALPKLVLNLSVSETGSFATAQIVRFALVFACLLVPTALMGAAFPLAARIAVTRRDAVGRTVGTLYAFNTVGAIMGSFAAGFLLIPFLGLRLTLLLAAGLNLLIALYLGLDVARQGAERSPRFLSFAPIAAGGAGILVGAIAPWNTDALSSGAYIYAVRAREMLASGAASPDDILESGETLYYKEGTTTTVTVHRAPNGEFQLRTNGKTDASTGLDMRTQVLLGHVPAFLAAGSESALVIGLGSGVTAGSIARHPFRTIDCVEISAEIVEAAGLFFDHVNFGVLRDARLNLVVGDGRTFVDLQNERYDVISSEPSNLWISGIANLFSEEFFRICRDHLSEGGVMAQALHAYDLTTADFRTVVRTFVRVFPEASLWELFRGEDYMLLGSAVPQRIDLSRIGDRSSALVIADLRRAGIVDTSGLTAVFLAGTDSLRGFAGDGPIHTDDNGLLAYSAPLTLHRNMSDANLEALEDAIGPIAPLLDGPEEARAEALARIAARRSARSHVTEARRLLENDRTEAAMSLLETALPNLPDTQVLRQRYVLYMLAAAKRSLESGDAAAALRSAENVLRVMPAAIEAAEAKGLALLALGRAAEAIPLLEAVRDFHRGAATATLNLGKAYLAAGRDDNARRCIEDVVRTVRIDESRRASIVARIRAGDCSGALAELVGSIGVQAGEFAPPRNPGARE